MQVDADIFCDTLLILREIERMHPSPTRYPGGTEAGPRTRLVGGEVHLHAGVGVTRFFRTGLPRESSWRAISPPSAVSAHALPLI
jgi:hypothetical protein